MKFHTDSTLSKLAEVLSEELAHDWQYLKEYGIDLHKLNERGEYYKDVYGEVISGRPDVNVFYLPTYSSSGKLPDVIRSKFEKSNSILSTVAGLDHTFIAFIGPHSVVPMHVDDPNREPNDPSQNLNVLLGIRVPSTDISQIGLRVNNEVIGHKSQHAVVFDAQIPHEAWNNTDDWWIAIVLRTDKEFCKWEQ